MLPLTLEDTPPSMLFLGSGSSISPLLSVLKHTLESTTTVMTTLIHSAKSSHLPLAARVTDLKIAHPRELEVKTTVTEQAGANEGTRVGRVDMEMLAPYAETCSMFYLSGGEEFVRGMVGLLVGQLGVWPGRIRTDFFPAVGGSGPSQLTRKAAAPREMRREIRTVSYTHLRAHETPEHLVCRLLLEKKKKEE
eukprot:TRINITY_DN25589_c0_g1_i1.p1 TRINITY_DN25589_c0_g1~~TRINITY_DN25589_c0_g1_i1.p1  ORF type:complete len:193 (-),score=54.16 TRINITY_DN25589_c0_g1_i1:36-614(-)